MIHARDVSSVPLGVALEVKRRGSSFCKKATKKRSNAGNGKRDRDKMALSPRRKGLHLVQGKKVCISSLEGGETGFRRQKKGNKKKPLAEEKKRITLDREEHVEQQGGRSFSL